jgi:hypothetical protein
MSHPTAAAATTIEAVASKVRLRSESSTWSVSTRLRPTCTAPGPTSVPVVSIRYGTPSMETFRSTATPEPAAMDRSTSSTGRATVDVDEMTSPSAAMRWVMFWSLTREASTGGMGARPSSPSPRPPRLSSTSRTLSCNERSIWSLSRCEVAA